jgi:L-alanine-DL-glutamate epimerase-like enolase superfamily enzyme
VRVRDVEAWWLHCPIAPERQHVSDFGRIDSFDTALVRIETADGLVGWGEAKAAVGSAGACAALVACINEELRPALVGRDATRINELADLMYNGPRAGYAATRGRVFPILGRRGLTVSAISGVDMALWDLRGRALGVPVVELLGGPCRAEMPLYASGGWGDVDAIGAELDELSFDLLQQAVADGATQRPAADRTLTQARRAVEKAAGLLRQLQV